MRSAEAGGRNFTHDTRITTTGGDVLVDFEFV